MQLYREDQDEKFQRLGNGVTINGVLARSVAQKFFLRCAKFFPALREKVLFLRVVALSCAFLREKVLFLPFSCASFGFLRCAKRFPALRETISCAARKIFLRCVKVALKWR